MHFKASEGRKEVCGGDFHLFLPLPRCDALWGGRLSIAVLTAAVLRAVGEAAGESSWTQGGSQESGEVEEDLLAPAAGAPAAAALAGAQQRPGQAVRHYTRYGRDAVSRFALVFEPLPDKRALPGVHHCQRKVSRCNSLKNLTLNDLLIVADSLPGVRVRQEDVLAVVSSCLPRQYILQLLHLWQTVNYDVDLAKGLSHSLRVMRSREAPRYLLRGLKKLSRIIGANSAHKLYEKMFVSMLQDETCFKALKPLN